MADTYESRKKKPYGKVILFGIISIMSYIGLFTNQNLVTEYYTRGGYYTALPVVTALYFSFLHGAFASNVLNALGLEAKKR